MAVVGMLFACVLLLLGLSPCLRGHVVIYPDDPYRNSQEMSEPGFKPEEEPYTDLTTDELISQAYERSGSHPVPESSSDHTDLDGTVLAEMDMRLTPGQFQRLYGTSPDSKTKRKAIKPEKYRWTNGVIPYEIATGYFSMSEVYNIKKAMQSWQDQTCLKFRPATSADKNRVRVQDGVGCSADLGMKGGLQFLTLEKKKCRNRGLYLHELGHTIGLVHEHQLPHRDKHLNIYLQNVLPKSRGQFSKYKQDEINDYGVGYDYASVMHYGNTAFAINQHYKTSSAKDPSKEKLIGKVFWKGLSFSDSKVVNLMYKCNKHCAANPNCLAPGYLDKDCRCVCPLGLNCGYGVKECNDTYYDTSKCAKWQKSGKCLSAAEWMYTHCQKTCDMCPPVPTLDPRVGTPGSFTHPPLPSTTPTVPGITTALPCFNQAGDAKCGRFVKRGDCNNDGKWWMRKNCQKACDVCPGKCVNIMRDSYCQRSASLGSCVREPEMMRSKCFKACHFCQDEKTKGECRDENPDCTEWARVGYCFTNQSTAKICRKACGFCKS